MYSLVLNVKHLITLVFQGNLNGSLDDVFDFEDCCYAVSLHSSKLGEKGIHPTAPGLYFISSPDSDKVYVGSTGDLARRRSQHYHELQKGHDNPNLKALLDKHDRDSFRFTSMEIYADRETLYQVEQHLYDLLREKDLILNVGLDIKAAWKGRVISDESKALMALAKIGKTTHDNQKKAMGKLWDNEEFREKMREGARARMADPEFKEKMRAVNRGKILTEEHRKKISEAGKGALRTNSRHISVNGTVYESLSRAVAATGYPESNLRNWANNPKEKFSHVFWV